MKNNAPRKKPNDIQKALHPHLYMTWKDWVFHIIILSVIFVVIPAGYEALTDDVGNTNQTSRIA